MTSTEHPIDGGAATRANLETAGRPTVYFDGGCPVCRREVSFYRKLPGADRVVWIDAAAAPDEALGPDLDRDTALNRMHVRDTDGRLTEGVAAFETMWRALPWAGPLAWLAGRKTLHPLLTRAYDGFLALRRRWGIGTPNRSGSTG